MLNMIFMVLLPVFHCTALKVLNCSIPANHPLVRSLPYV